MIHWQWHHKWKLSTCPAEGAGRLSGCVASPKTTCTRPKPRATRPWQGSLWFPSPGRAACVWPTTHLRHLLLAVLPTDGAADLDPLHGLQLVKPLAKRLRVGRKRGRQGVSTSRHSLGAAWRRWQGLPARQCLDRNSLACSDPVRFHWTAWTDLLANLVALARHLCLLVSEERVCSWCGVVCVGFGASSFGY